MITRRIAVIDLGSNTFHLLIADILPDGRWFPLHKDRRYVKLASGGLDQINEETIERGVRVMAEFAEQIKAMDVAKVKAIGTAALREANNGNEVVSRLVDACGFPIEIIDGHREARYILKGIQSALPEMDDPCLIMDIGGGSVEFILYQKQDLLFTGSFKIGVAVLFEKFHHEDPIPDETILSMRELLEEELRPLLDGLTMMENYDLIGASGSFEVIQDAMPKLQEHGIWSELEISTLETYLEKVIHANLESRKKMPEIPVERLDYIVMAYVLILFLIEKKRPKRLFYCDYALKEGIIAEEIADF